MTRRTAAVLACTVAVSALTAPTVASTVASAAPVRRLAATHQSAYVLLGGSLHVSAGSHRAPIASMAKVMTAYLVLRRYPLRGTAAGFTMTVTQADVDDRARRVARGESTVPVAVGEHLTERQALVALLLPSANNVAIMLARRVGGSVTAFVTAMNSAARTLHMTRTTYTDPSGFDSATVSTPDDQVRMALAVMHDPVFRSLVATRSYRIPVAGTVHNTDTLLRTDGFLGIKTGSMSASGGCFMFRSYRNVGGVDRGITGVVMGYYGADLVQAGLAAAKRLVDAVAPRPWPL